MSWSKTDKALEGLEKTGKVIGTGANAVGKSAKMVGKGVAWTGKKTGQGVAWTGKKAGQGTLYAADGAVKTVGKGLSTGKSILSGLNKFEKFVGKVGSSAVDILGGDFSSLSGVISDVDKGLDRTFKSLSENGIGLNKNKKNSKNIEFENENTDIKDNGLEGFDFKVQNKLNESDPKWEEKQEEVNTINKNISKLQHELAKKENLERRVNFYSKKPTGGILEENKQMLDRKVFKAIEKLKEEVVEMFEIEHLKYKNDLIAYFKKNKKMLDKNQIKILKENVKKLKSNKKQISNFIKNSVDEHTDNAAEIYLENVSKGDISFFIGSMRGVIETNVSKDYENIYNDLDIRKI